MERGKWSVLFFAPGMAVAAYGSNGGGGAGGIQRPAEARMPPWRNRAVAAVTITNSPVLALREGVP